MSHLQLTPLIHQSLSTNTKSELVLSFPLKAKRWPRAFRLQASILSQTTMKVAIVLSLTLALAAGSPVIKVERPANTGRIVGGVEATPHEFPWMVDMRRPSHYCGATIISPEWVVTAAHCTTGAPSGYTLVAGDHNIQSSEGREQTRQVVAIISHPNYNGNTIENDIALMKVDPPFEFNQWVSAVQLPESTFAPTRKIARQL